MHKHYWAVGAFIFYFVIASIAYPQQQITFIFIPPYSKEIEKIVQILSDNDAKAVFCIRGKDIETIPQLQRITNSNNFICNYTYSGSLNLQNVSWDEIKIELKLTNKLIREKLKVDNFIYLSPLFYYTQDFKKATAHFKNAKTISFHKTSGLKIKEDIDADLITTAIKDGIRTFLISPQIIAKKNSQFGELLKKINELNFKVKPSKKLFQHPWRTFKTSYYFIKSRTNIPSKKIYLLLMTNTPPEILLKFLKFFYKHKININIVIHNDRKSKMFLQDIYNKYKEYRTLSNIVFSYLNIECGKLEEEVFLQSLSYIQQNVLYPHLKKIERKVVIPCSVDQLSERFLTMLRATLGIEKFIFLDRYIGMPFIEKHYPKNLTKKVEENIFNSLLQIFPHTEDEEFDILYNISKEFAKSKNMKNFIKMESHNRLRMYVRNINGNYTILINPAVDGVFQITKKIVRLLKNRGFTFEHIK
jgi:hypothetical protein